jgi:hypothetical protein
MRLNVILCDTVTPSVFQFIGTSYNGQKHGRGSWFTGALNCPSTKILTLLFSFISVADKILATLGEGTFGKVVKVKELNS